MKLFRCDSCENLVFYENVRCVRCQHTLGFLTDFGTMSAMEDAGNGEWLALLPEAKRARYRQCGNGRQHEACNWLIPAKSQESFCPACRLNSLIPDLTVTGNLERWRKIELAKRRVLYTLNSLGIPCDGRRIAPEGPELQFRFVGTMPQEAPPLTGHEHGVITLNIVEADDDERERRRVRLREPFRTLVGHLRHELAHYYWDLLISRSNRLEECRTLFGDERQDYAAALQNYYNNGPAERWQDRCVSAYASAHPWEDWAETFAHYLHITDTLQTAGCFGLVVNPPASKSESERSDPVQVAKRSPHFERLMRHWPPLTCAINELNRGMGLPDLYPFIIAPPVIGKLEFIHETFREVQSQKEASNRPRGWMDKLFGRKPRWRA